MTKASESDPPYLLGTQFRYDDFARPNKFPFNLPWLENFELTFDSPVTFFVGENGSGKSTLMEALAVLSRLPVSGGGTQDATSVFGPEKTSELAQELSPVFKRRPRDGYFFRAEYYAQYASLLDQRRDDPDFRRDPYKSYGGKSLHTRSHGESFLELMQNRFGEGLFFLDEPESALSPQRQLTLLAMIADRIKDGKSQFIIATHSPILLTFPGATILNFDEAPLMPISIEETMHFQITQGILDHPERYWKHLVQTAEIQECDKKD